MFSKKDVAGWRRELGALDELLASHPASPGVVQKLRAHGRMEAAIEACEEVAEEGSYGADSWSTLADLLAQAGRRDEAREALSQACRLELEALGIAAEDREEAALYLLARRTGDAAPDKAPAAYVRTLFDRAAEDFDRRLVGRLGYRGPQLLAAAVSRRLGQRTDGLRVLDVGCGTGLAAELLRPLARRLDGVDISPRMLEKARARNAYDRLVGGDFASGPDESEPYDLIFAADVFSYIGDLAAVLRVCGGRLSAEGLLAATVEASGDANFVLRVSGRYAHSNDYVKRALGEAGFEAVEIEPAVLRHEASAPVESLLVTAIRADTECPSPAR